MAAQPKPGLHEPNAPHTDQMNTAFERSFAELEREIRNVKADLVRSLFLFWLGTVATVLAIIDLTLNI